MSPFLGFSNWVTRSERRNSKRRKTALGLSLHNRRLLCEPLEVRTLLSAVVPQFSPDLHIEPKGDPDGSSSPSGLDPTPNQVRAAYGLGTYTNGVLTGGISFDGIPADGRGQTIAIVDAYDFPNALSDLNSFSSSMACHR